MARAPARRVPASAARFTVDLGKAGSAGHGIAQVVLPRLAVGEVGMQEPLLLSRIASADRLFHDWWVTAHRRKSAMRTVTIGMLAPDGGSLLFSWRFLKARPVALHYGVLDGAVDVPLEETIELMFEGVERV